MIRTIIVLISLFVLSSADTIFTKEELQFIKSSPIVKVGSIDSYTPFSFIEDGMKIGFTQELLEIISKKSGLKFEKVGGTWPEVFGQFKNGTIDIISELSYREERLKFTTYTKPYYEIPVGVFTRDDFGIYKNLESLKGKKVGIVKNSYLINVIKNIKDIDVVEIETTDGRFFALDEKKVDAVLSNAMSIHRVEKLMLHGIKLAGIFSYPKVKSEDLRFGIRKEKPLLASIINKSLNNISFSEMTKLKQKWIVNISDDASDMMNSIRFTIEEKNYLDSNAITMCIDPNWMPFEKFDENDNYVGMSADYYKLFEKMIGKKFKVIHSKTWSESIDFAKQRKCDILSLAMETPSRTKYLNFTMPYVKMPLVITTKIGVPFINNMESLQGKRIGIPKGYAFIEILHNKYPDLEIVEVADINEGLKLVNHDQLYAYIGTLATVDYTFQTKYQGELKISGKMDENIELGIGVRNDEPVLFNILQKVVSNITVEQHKNILNRWVSVKYEKEIDYSLLWKISIAFGTILLIVLYFFAKEIILKRKLQYQKEEFESIFKSSKDGIAIIDLESNFLDFNNAYLEMTGYTKEQLMKKNCIELTAPPYKNMTQEVFKEVLKKGYVENFEKECIMFNNKRVSVNLSVTLMPDKNRLLLMMKDVSNIKLMEEQEKLVSMGEMIGNIAHQWRQPLSVISTLASAMKVKIEYEQEIDKSTIIDSSDKIVEQTQYLSQTIDDFKNFIKGDDEYHDLSIKALINSTLNLVNASLANNYVQVIKDIEDDLHISGGVSELEQAIINILNNAKDIIVQKHTDDNRYIFITTKKINDGMLELKIVDNGGGIAENIIDRIFEPYFTTKHQSIGTGLGLAMANKIIVERHHQILKVFNEEFEYKGNKYKGACFSIIFKAS